MQFALAIDYVDGTTQVTVNTEDIGSVAALLEVNDHEGAVLSLSVQTDTSEEVYAILNALTMVPSGDDSATDDGA
jgi:hypothetical protein